MPPAQDAAEAAGAAARPPRKRKGAAPKGGCCASKPARESPAQTPAAPVERPLPPPPDSYPGSASAERSAASVGAPPQAAPGTSAAILDAGGNRESAAALSLAAVNGASRPAGAKSTDGVSAASLSSAASTELRKQWAAVSAPPVLLTAKVTGTERLPTDDVGWGGLAGATAMHYHIAGTVRRSDGSERSFTTACRYSLLHELHTRMSHDRLGVQSMEEQRQLQAGLALFPQKSWLGGESVVASREMQISRWLDYWAHLAETIEHTGHTVEIQNSALARCSALLAEYLDEDTEQQDLIEASLRPTESQAASKDLDVSLLPRSARHPSKPRPRSDGNNGTTAPKSGDTRIIPDVSSTTGARPPRKVPSAKLRVQIYGVRSVVGAVRIALWNSSDSWLQDESRSYHQRFDLHPSDVGDEARFETLLPAMPVEDAFGQPLEYAMMAIHDLNDLGSLDTNLIGIPRDGISCSNGASGGPSGGPKWNAAKFVLVCNQIPYPLPFDTLRHTVPSILDIAVSMN